MLFGRRGRVPLWRRVLNWIWPRAGLKRAGAYIGHRVQRLPGTPYSIAAGLACGAAVSCTPFIGFHFLFGAVLALLIGGNLVASAIGTAAGNPWTFPFIWSWIYFLGRLLLGEDTESDIPSNVSLAYIFDRPADVLYPMVVGSVPTAIVVWLIVFWPCYKAISKYQARRREKRMRAKRRLMSTARPGGGYETEGEG